MNPSVSRSSPGCAVPRANYGRVSVFFGEKNGKYPDANQVIVLGSDSRAAFDTPLTANHIGAEFDTADLVILSHVHEDHMAGLHRLPETPVYVHEADLAAAQSWDGMVAAYGADEAYVSDLLLKFQREFFYVPRPDAIGYREGAVWDLGSTSIHAIHMPGHTAGHSVLMIEPEGIAFIGDIDLSGFGPYYGDTSSSLADFRRSLARLPELPAQIWITSHHRGVYMDRRSFLRDLATYAAKIDSRGERLLESLRMRPRSLEQLVDCRLLYPPDYQELWVNDVERRTIQRHLTELLSEGRVAVDEAGIYHPA